MRYKKGSVEYLVNYESLREIEEAVPMTEQERHNLKLWVKDGHDIDTNPWKIFEPDGSTMNYLKAWRVRYGASHGPWDAWEYAHYICFDPDGAPDGFSFAQIK